MKRTTYLGPSAAPRGRNSSHSRSHTPTPLPKAPLPFTLPSLRREAGGDGAGGGIAGAGAKWASPRADYGVQQLDGDSSDVRAGETQALPDASKAQPQAPRAWGGAGMKVVRSPPDFPELGDRTVHQSHPASHAQSSTVNSLTTLSPSPAVDRQRTKTSTDDVRALTRNNDSNTRAYEKNGTGGDARSTSHSGLSPSFREAHADAATYVEARGRVTSAHPTSTNPPISFGGADEDDWAQDDDVMDFSDPNALPDLPIPEIPPPPPQSASVVSRPPPHLVPRSNQFVQNQGRPSTHQPPAAHWADAIRLQEEEEKRMQNGGAPDGARGHAARYDARARYEPVGHIAPVVRGPRTVHQPVDLGVIKDQKTIMRTKAEIAHEARMKAEEEMLRQRRERTARKLRELDERMKSSQTSSASSQRSEHNSGTPSNEISERVTKGGEEGHLQETAQSLVTLPVPSVVETSPRMVLQRPKEHSRDSRAAGLREMTPRGIPGERVIVHSGPSRRARNTVHVRREQAAIDRYADGDRNRQRFQGGPNYDGPTGNETREQWLDRRRRKTETRDIVRHVIDICIHRAVYGRRSATKHPDSRRGMQHAALIAGKRETVGQSLSLQPRTRSRIEGSGKNHVFSSNYGLSTPSQLRGSFSPGARNSNHSKPDLNYKPNVSSEDAPAPLRPAPWAKRPKPAGDYGVDSKSDLSSSRGISGAVATLPDNRADVNSRGGASGRFLPDPTPRESISVDKSTRVHPQRSRTERLNPSSVAIEDTPPGTKQSSHVSAGLPSSTSRQEDAVAILPPLGGNVTVLMNPHVRRDAQGNATVPGPRAHAIGARHSGVQADVSYDKSRPSAARHRGISASVLQNGVDMYRRAESNETQDVSGGRKVFLRQSVPSPYESGLVAGDGHKSKGEESSAWKRPSPPTSFDAITRAFSNQPAAFPLVGAPLIPPVPVVQVISAPNSGAAGSYGPGNGAWPAAGTWSDHSGAATAASGWWPSTENKQKEVSHETISTSEEKRMQNCGDVTRRGSQQKRSVRSSPATGHQKDVPSTDNGGRPEGSAKSRRRPSRGGKKPRKSENVISRTVEALPASTELPSDAATVDPTSAGRNPQLSESAHKESLRSARSEGLRSKRTKSIGAPNVIQTAENSNSRNVSNNPSVSDIGISPPVPDAPSVAPESSKSSAMQTGRTSGRSRGRRAGGKSKKRTEAPRTESVCKHLVASADAVAEVPPENDGPTQTLKCSKAASSLQGPAVDENKSLVNPKVVDEAAMCRKEANASITGKESSVHAQGIAADAVSTDLSGSLGVAGADTKVGDTLLGSHSATGTEKNTSADGALPRRGRSRRGRSWRGRTGRGGRGRGGRGSRGRGFEGAGAENSGLAGSNTITQSSAAEAVTNNVNK